MEALLSPKDVFVRKPTGGGKTLPLVIPVLVREIWVAFVVDDSRGCGVVGILWWSWWVVLGHPGSEPGSPAPAPTTVY